MCAHFEGVVDPTRLRQYFNAAVPAAAAGGASSSVKTDLWPGYTGLFIRKATGPVHEDGEPAEGEAVPGMFGLVPNWATDLKLARHTYNARTETVASKPSFRDAWRQARHCIIPAQAIYEPDWRSGKSIPARITRADGQPMGIAGLWDQWRHADGTLIHSFTMLTINAQDHALMNRFHQPTDEKRMVVILPESAYGDWLVATARDSMEFMTAYPAEALVAEASPPVPAAPKQMPSGGQRTTRVVNDAQGSLL